MNSILRRGTALIMVLAMLSSCAMDSLYPRGREANLASYSASRLIDHFYGDVTSNLLKEGEITPEQYEMISQLSGVEVTTRAIGEENGRSYLDFLEYSKSGDTIRSTEEIVDRAKGLVPEEKLNELRETARDVEAKVISLGEAELKTRALNATQKESFNKELRALVVKSVVLLVSAVVYACIPTTILWGKVVAATAIAVAAGVLATTIGVIIDYKNGDVGKDQALKTWLEEISKEPVAAAAIASGITNTAVAMGASPLVSGLILLVFTLWNVKDEIKPLLDKYNLKT